MNELLEVLCVQGVTIVLKIHVKKAKSLRLGISDDEKLTLGNDNIDRVGRLTYQSRIISKDGGSSEDVKGSIVKTQGLFIQLKKSLEEQKDKSANHD